MTGYAKRLLGTAIVTAALAGAIAVYVGLYLTAAPPSVAATSTPSGPHLYLASVAAAEVKDPHSTWVSFYATDANSNHWVHATTYILPAHTLIHVTIFQYDTQTGLRNPFIGQATGVPGNTFLLDGKPVQGIDPTTAAHVWAVPQIGVSVPLEGVSSNAKNPCGNAPCSLSNAHHTISFSFRTPGRGLYRWQCFVPCAAGFIEGNGGPMQTIGYMGGFIKVV